jgi:hypothetical protein
MDNTAQRAQENEKVGTEVLPVAPTAWMPRKTLILIIGLAIVTALLLILALAPSLRFPAKTTTKPAVIANYAYTELSFSKPVALQTSGYKTDVLISTGKNKVTAVQLEITYDPKILTNVDIKPGAFFTNPTILLKKIDPIKGEITDVLGIGLGQKAVSGNGTVATITFSTLPGQITIKTPINFSPKTAVNAMGYVQSVLVKSSGVLFSLTPTPTP